VARSARDDKKWRDIDPEKLTPEMLDKIAELLIKKALGDNTLQRRIKNWRATEGPSKEVFFAQQHQPGELCQSDFTHCRELGITIGGYSE
jgi:hypothetical protein